MSLRFQCLEFKYNSLWDSLGPLCIWDFLSGTWGSTACGSGFTTLCGVSLSCLWDSPVITTSGILGVSLCVLPFSGSFFTWNALGEYWTPPGSSCSHACSPQCMDSVQNGLWACFSSLVALVLDLREYLWVPRISLHVSIRFALTLSFIVLMTHFLFDMYNAQLRELRIFRPKSNSAGLTPVVEWGRLLYAAR